MKAIISLLLFIVIGVTMSFIPLRLSDWEYWIILGAVMGISVLSHLRGIEQQ